MRLVPLNVFKPPSDLFADRSKAVFFGLFFLIYVSCLSLLCCLVCSLQPCDHLTGKGLALRFLVFCHFPMWCFGSGVLLALGSCLVLDCIDAVFLTFLEDLSVKFPITRQTRPNYAPGTKSCTVLLVTYFT